MGKHEYATTPSERYAHRRIVPISAVPRGQNAVRAVLISLLLSTVGALGPRIAFAFDWDTTYPRVVEFLAQRGQQFVTDCENGDAHACQGLQALNGLVDTLNALGTHCQNGEAAACKVLMVEVWGTDTLRMCEAGQQQSCAEFEQARQLKTACGEGDTTACERLLQMME